MLYFAYGSNLDPEQMQFRCPGAKAVGLAALRDHRLAFPLYSNAWGGGVSSVQLAHGDTVWGMLFDLTEQHLQTLDGYEEFRGPGDQHNVYDRGQVTVELTRPDDGSFPRLVRAWTYIARPAKPSPPSRRYLDAILKGARHHRLPEEYIAKLAAVQAAPEAEAPAGGAAGAGESAGGATTC